MLYCLIPSFHAHLGSLSVSLGLHSVVLLFCILYCCSLLFSFFLFLFYRLNFFSDSEIEVEDFNAFIFQI